MRFHYALAHCATFHLPTATSHSPDSPINHHFLVERCAFPPSDTLSHAWACRCRTLSSSSPAPRWKRAQTFLHKLSESRYYLNLLKRCPQRPPSGPVSPTHNSCVTSSDPGIPHNPVSICVYDGVCACICFCALEVSDAASCGLVSQKMCLPSFSTSVMLTSVS